MVLQSIRFDWSQDIRKTTKKEGELWFFHDVPLEIAKVDRFSNLVELSSAGYGLSTIYCLHWIIAGQFHSDTQYPKLKKNSYWR